VIEFTFLHAVDHFQSKHDRAWKGVSKSGLSSSTSSRRSNRTKPRGVVSQRHVILVRPLHVHRRILFFLSHFTLHLPISNISSSLRPPNYHLIRIRQFPPNPTLNQISPLSIPRRLNERLLDREIRLRNTLESMQSNPLLRKP
jgi:hypothetical protein